MNRKYTEEHLAYIAANVKGRSYRDLTDMFNKYFGMNVKVSALSSLCFKHRLLNERDCHFNTGYEPTQFKKGLVPWNKGMKGVNFGGKRTQFKKGQKGWNYKPVGSERIDVDGYTWVKVTDPKTWRMKHVLIWEAANGPVPKGHVVIFADGDKSNIVLDNLLLVSRRELAVMNKRGLIASSAELTKAGVTIADIYLKIGERKKR